MWSPICKLLQRRTIDAIGECNRSDWAAWSILMLVGVIIAACHIIGIHPSVAARVIIGRSCGAGVNNIGGGDFSERLCHEPIDVVYTWVNGSDTVWLAEMIAYRARWDSTAGRMMTDEEERAGVIAGVVTTTTSNSTNSSTTTREEDMASAMSRYRDNNELRYSIRSLYKYAPWIRHIYLVTNGQVPAWLDTDQARVSVITHADIFPNPSDLPTFSSPAIEAHLHRIPGLSRRFVYFNDDVMLGAPVWPDAFFTHIAGQKFYPAWDVPKCAPGCVDNWISDGYCDSACNNTACLWDGGDCLNNTKTRGGASSSSTYKSSMRYDPSQYDRVTSSSSTDSAPAPATTLLVWSQPCAPGCNDEWLGDLVCDRQCQTAACGWDTGDCGDGELPPRYNGTIESSSSINITGFWERLSFALRSELIALREARVPAPALLLPCRNGSFGGVNESDDNTTATEAVNNGISCSSVPLAAPEMIDNGLVIPNLLDAVNAAIDVAVIARGKYATAQPVSLATPNGDCICTGNGTECIDIVAHGARLDLFHVLTDAGHRMALVSTLRAHVYECIVNVSAGGEGAALDCALASTESVLNSAEIRVNVTATSPARIVDAEQFAESALRLALLAPLRNSFILLAQVEAVLLANAEDFELKNNETAARFPCVSDRGVDNYVTRTCAMGVLRLWLNVTSSENGNFLLLDLTLPLDASVRSRANACAVRIHPPIATATATTANGTVDSNETTTFLITSPSDSTSPTLTPSPTTPSIVAPEAHSLRLRASSHDGTSDNGRRGRRQDDTIDTGRRGRRLVEKEEDVISHSLYEPSPPLRWAAAAHADAQAALGAGGDARSILSGAWAGLVALSLSAASPPASIPAAHGRRLADFYAESLVATNRLVTAAFGKRSRKVPSHMPHMIDTKAMTKVQEKWPEAFRTTSARRFRTGVDVQYAFAYFHFLLEGGARNGLDVAYFFSHELDADGDGALSYNELLTLGAIVYRHSPSEHDIKTLRECLVGTAAPADVTVSRVRDGVGVERIQEVRTARVRLPTWETLINCPIVVEAISKHGRFGPMAQDMGMTAADDVSFEMVGDDANKTLLVLDGVRTKRPRFICINDDMKSPGDAVRGVLKDFYESFVGKPSPLELPVGSYNEVLYIAPLRALLFARKTKKVGLALTAIVGLIVSLIALAVLAGSLCRVKRKLDYDTWSARSRRAYEALASPGPPPLSTLARAKMTARRNRGE